MSERVIIDVQGLVRRFGELEAVRGVTFQVREGEIFGFLGPNGAGKTTTIKMLATLLRPTAGTALLNGYDIRTDPDGVRRSIGLVFQDPSLDERLTARENLEFHALLYGVEAGEREARLRRVLAMVELEDRQHHLVKTFSGGMKRRLEIARGLLHYPAVLFLDEPTIGLDPQTRSHIWSYIHQLRRQEGITIFLTTHYMEEAENCDRIAIIDHGQIVALDTPDGLKSLVGGDVITVRTTDQAWAREEIRRLYGREVVEEDDLLRFEVERGEEFIPRLAADFAGRLLSVGLRRPTLDDVFLKLTGRAIRQEEVSATDRMREHHRRRFHR
ncbi:MAG: ATP-binding cassette domain-containing protein [Bacillota bacterium]|nr:ATP-binding cassette domain-containing protein [Bacillota bacterium]